MDELEKNIPDDFWRKAFEDASEAPPPRVWDAIEHRLDESNNPTVLPLWGTGLLASKSFTWGAGVAAAVALLLVGWWMMDTQMQTTDKQVAYQQKVTSEKPLQTAPDRSGRLSVTKAKEAQVKQAQQAPEPEAIAAVTPPAKRAAPGSHAESNLSAEPLFTVSEESRIAQQTNHRVVHHRLRAEPRMQENPVGVSSTNVLLSTESRAFADHFKRSARAEEIAGQETNALYGNPIAELASQPMRLRSLDRIHRIVWFRSVEGAAEPEVVRPSREPKEVWASVSMMPSSFNPTVALRPSQTVMLATAATGNQASISSRADFSVAYQAGAGVQLTERWSVESGIGYLAGHSTVQSPGQSVMNYASGLVQSVNSSATAGNLYANAVRNSSGTIAADVMNSAPVGNYVGVAVNNYQRYDSQHQQEIANNYEYIQVPMQIGYQLRPRKRLSMALLGGLLTNVFVRNTIGDDLVITGKDGVYRPLAWAATMGARFRYRPSRRWSASLAGMYQPSLGSGTHSASQIESSPTSAGMSFGLDYHF